jgi:LPXTG-motif cell wall-anchored protein
MLVPHSPPSPPGPHGPGAADVVVPHGPGEAAVLTGLILALAVIAGGIWWVRRRRKRT